MEDPGSIWEICLDHTIIIFANLLVAQKLHTSSFSLSQNVIFLGL